MEPRRLRHRIEYTKNKHSRAICKGDTIIIRLARNLSKAEEQEHIQSLLRRMTHLVLEEREKKAIDPFRHLLTGGQTLTVSLDTGKRYLFTLHPATKTRAVRARYGWRIDVSPQVRRARLHRFFWSLLSHAELPRIRNLVHRINEETFNVPVRDVRLSFATTQWGSCSPKGVIMLNTALLFLPPRLLRYVIIHELAHRRHPNHSDAYWREVESVLPGYRKPYRELQNYRLPQL
ncbi:MAG TPA: M48 family metallopeptidase [Candidatus Peribacteraceae bacterium]|nr:M48 family metallopeptidase [Candidatus Peribacteraceae bacterium]